MKGNEANMSMKKVKLIFRVIWTLKWLKMTINVTMSMKEAKLTFRVVWTLKWPKITHK